MKTMRNFLIALLLASASLPASAQEKRDAYEYMGDIPVYVDSIQQSLTYPLAWRNCKDRMTMDEWRQVARQKVLELMGPQPPRPEKWDMKLLAEEKRDGYRAQKIEFSLSRWYRVKAYLLIPDASAKSKRGAKFPAVNLLHDHGAHLFIGKEKMIRPFDDDSVVIADADRWVENLYEGQYLGDYLARQGYVVFSIDAPLWGERGRKEGVDRNRYDIIAGNMMMLGRNLCAFMHYDDIVSTEFLASLPFVDKSRIGCAGCSMGAYRAWMLSALSDDIAAGCAVCWMNTTEDQLTLKYGRKENGGFANSIPLLRNYMDYPDIASLAVPKPMLFISGDKDKLFPVPGVEKAFARMHEVWGETDRLETRIEAQPHECNLKNQNDILSFFDKYLKSK